MEWISAVLTRTGADGVVVDDFALSIGSTGAWTGVDTPLLDTRHRQRTLRAEQTLRPTVGRTSEVSLETGADRAGTLGTTLAVGTAGVRVTRVHWHRGRRYNGDININISHSGVKEAEKLKKKVGKLRKSDHFILFLYKLSYFTMKIERKCRKCHLS